VTERLLETGLFLLAAILIYGFREKILARLSRFDATNRERIVNEQRDRSDSLAHFRHTLGRAEEQVEAVSEITVPDARTGTPVTRYIFEAEQFATRMEAERVRAERVRALARSFYSELPTALAERKGDGKLR
jgi:hypothetical protein